MRRERSSLPADLPPEGAARRRVRPRPLAFLLAIGAGVSPFLAPGCIEARAFYYPGSAGLPAPAGAEDVRFPTTGGLTLHGWFIPASSPTPGPAPTVLHVHGNAGDVSDHLVACEFLAEVGFNVLLFDYRGFGRSDRGRLRRERLVEDTQAALDYLLARPDVDRERVAVFGYSLGGVLGLAASERPEVRAVVVYAAFSTWRGVAADHGGVLGRVLIRSGRDAADSVRRLGDRPLLIVHGTDDQVVPYHHGAALLGAANAAGVPAELLRVEGGDHFSIATDPAVREAVAAFLRRELGAPPS